MPQITTPTGTDLFYRDDGTGQPALFIQGLGIDHRGWAGITRPLSQQFRCISFDNRDVGRSSIATSDYTVADLASDAIALLDALGIEQADIVGQSMGGAIAQELAIRYPDRVRRLVLITTYTSGDPRGSAIFAGQALLRRTLSREDYCRATFWSSYSHQDYRRDDGFVEMQITRAAANDLWQPQDAYERQVRATTTANTEDRLHKITAPTLILAGAEDILTPARFSSLLARDIPNARLQIVEGAAHALIWSHPELVTQSLSAFLTN